MAKRDIRHLPFAQQIAIVREYHRRKAVSASRSDGNEDPFISVDNVAKRFRCLCPEGLLRAYEAAEARREEARRAAARATADAALATGSWYSFTGAERQHVDALVRCGRAQRKRTDRGWIYATVRLRMPAVSTYARRGSGGEITFGVPVFGVPVHVAPEGADPPDTGEAGEIVRLPPEYAIPIPEGCPGLIVAYPARGLTQRLQLPSLLRPAVYGYVVDEDRVHILCDPTSAGPALRGAATVARRFARGASQGEYGTRWLDISNALLAASTAV